jgi:hypothetical protein
MQLYKVSFVKNKIFSCTVVDHNISFEGNTLYRGKNNEPIFAVVCADNDESAQLVAKDLLETTGATEAMDE